MNWLVKSAIRHSALSMPGGAGLYRWLTIELLKTQSGMAAKWFRVFPAHIQVLREHFGAEARTQRLWCFDSGATPAAGFAMAIATDFPGLLTDRFDRLSNRYGEVSREVLRRDGPRLAQLLQRARRTRRTGDRIHRRQAKPLRARCNSDELLPVSRTR